MSDIKISELQQASTVNPDDLVLLTQEVGNTFESKSAPVSQIARATYIDMENFTVATSDWNLQAQPDFSGFPYVATIAIVGVTANDIAEVVPSIGAINWGKLCPLNNTVANGVNIYASELPSSSIVIERISVREMGL